jgi:hypothetical protein
LVSNSITCRAKAAWEKTPKIPDDEFRGFGAPRANSSGATTALPESLGVAVEQYLLRIGIQNEADCVAVCRRPSARPFEEVMAAEF